jgi:hypothetical protein
MIDLPSFFHCRNGFKPVARCDRSIFQGLWNDRAENRRRFYVPIPAPWASYCIDLCPRRKSSRYHQGERFSDSMNGFSLTSALREIIQKVSRYYRQSKFDDRISALGGIENVISSFSIPETCFNFRKYPSSLL